MTSSRPLRADAIRNRAKILTAASEQISRHGIEIGMDEIAAAAGVAVGTLYRHFPNKTELVAAVVVDFFHRVADDAEAANQRVVEGASALDEITNFLRRVIEAAAINHAAKAAASAMGTHPGDPAAEQRSAAAVTSMIKAGQTAGDIHPDVTVDDIYLLVNSAPTDQPPAARRRWLALVLPGLTTHPRR
ncbi:TetR family transcriptional regulator [Actinoplanes philippinensis]|uniref:DNA-binding transcriptional regulator, AcrR family n=1 Tax=Actinoplanes philippinensis TaxID=35752 RepID=A0A1I2I830_9ACTN|nr:TetR/AcrR family transcriptional regulator [Actinoplanes philippinensis]GIE78515.1 TetR family transcriptional regulator [Actinoplanes philippinensis]SFF38394.1 DNA-binding transcriptional regulator, AcrR family [Actinoplanes philippinensis]